MVSNPSGPREQAERLAANGDIPKALILSGIDFGPNHEGGDFIGSWKDAFASNVEDLDQIPFRHQIQKVRDLAVESGIRIALCASEQFNKSSRTVRKRFIAALLQRP